MKKMKRSTWIAILCVFLAIMASQIYGTITTERAEHETVTMVAEDVPKTETKLSKEPASSPVPEEKRSEKINTSVKDTLSEKTQIEQTEEITKITRPVSAPNTPEVTPSSPISFSLPSAGEVTTKYSDKNLIYFAPLKEWRCHLGIDFLPHDSDSVFACADGTVENIYEDHLYGTTVLLSHADGYKTYYSSLSEVSVTIGQAVEQGQEIAHMGQTAAIEEGIHLHFAMEKDGKFIDPLSENQ